MLTVNPIMNVNNTPNINFGNGVQTNHGVNAPSPKANMVEGGLIPGFFGTITNQIHSRAQSIEKGLESKKLNFFA